MASDVNICSEKNHIPYPNMEVLSTIIAINNQHHDDYNPLRNETEGFTRFNELSRSADHHLLFSSILF